MPNELTAEQQQEVDRTRLLIENRLADVTDFFKTGDFNGTCNEENLEDFKHLLETLGFFTDEYGITGNIGKIV